MAKTVKRAQFIKTEITVKAVKMSTKKTPAKTARIEQICINEQHQCYDKICLQDKFLIALTPLLFTVFAISSTLYKSIRSKLVVFMPLPFFQCVNRCSDDLIRVFRGTTFNPSFQQCRRLQLVSIDQARGDNKRQRGARAFHAVAFPDSPRISHSKRKERSMDIFIVIR